MSDVEKAAAAVADKVVPKVEAAESAEVTSLAAHNRVSRNLVIAVLAVAAVAAGAAYVFLF